MTGGIVRTDNKVIYEPEHNQPGQAGESTFCSLCRGFAEKLSSSLEQFSEVIGSLCNPGQNNAPSTEEDARALEITKKERKLERLKLDFGQAKERYNLSGQLISSIEREIMDLQDRKPQIQKKLTELTQKRAELEDKLEDASQSPRYPSNWNQQFDPSQFIDRSRKTASYFRDELNKTNSKISEIYKLAREINNELSDHNKALEDNNVKNEGIVSESKKIRRKIKKTMSEIQALREPNNEPGVTKTNNPTRTAIQKTSQ